ncbi:MAG: phosphopyruvate hydratase [Ruminococcaceae bacterium]|nr:phosphopyruvate hydratase [Oscillospiraceae bacterium]
MKQYIEILDVFAREILDSRGNPTLEAEVICEGGYIGRAAVPSGASTGEHEAVEKRDGDMNRYFGKGVENAVEAINNEISDKIVGMNVLDQLLIDKTLIETDGSENKGNFGANAILGVSLACAKAAANALGVGLYNYVGGAMANVLPVPMMNILNGGAHANNNIDIQEFMIMPTGAKSFKEALRMCAEVFHSLKGVLSSKGLITSVGDEGGFAPALEKDEDALMLICEAVEKAGYKMREHFHIAIDAASSEWALEGGRYKLPKSSVTFSTDELINYWSVLCDRYPIISIEDPLGENDWEGWQKITDKLGKKVQLVGDDLFVTNQKRLKIGLDKKCANSVLVKVNQIGTLSETALTVTEAIRHSYTSIMSHRSGETEDTTIADLAVAFGCGQIKTGAPSRSDRCAKYNRLLRIEEELGENAVYPGLDAFNIANW